MVAHWLGINYYFLLVFLRTTSQHCSCFQLLVVLCLTSQNLSCLVSKQEKIGEVVKKLIN